MSVPCAASRQAGGVHEMRVLRHTQCRIQLCTRSSRFLQSQRPQRSFNAVAGRAAAAAGRTTVTAATGGPKTRRRKKQHGSADAARRVASASEPGKILISASAWERISDLAEFDIGPERRIEASRPFLPTPSCYLRWHFDLLF